MLRRSPGSDQSLQEATNSQHQSLLEAETEFPLDQHQHQHQIQPQLVSPYRKRRSTHHHPYDPESRGPSISRSASVDSDSLHDSNNSNSLHHQEEDDHDNKKAKNTTMIKAMLQYMNSTRLMVLVVLCLQNSLFTILRRYSQGVLQEAYSKVRLCMFVAAFPWDVSCIDQISSSPFLLSSMNSCW